jgi:hypothetical protein
LNPLLHLVGSVLAFGLGVACAVCIARTVPALVAGDRNAVCVWLLRTVGSGAGCLGLSGLTRSLVGG